MFGPDTASTLACDRRRRMLATAADERLAGGRADADGLRGRAGRALIRMGTRLAGPSADLVDVPEMRFS